MPIGKKIIRLNQTNSTNDYASSLLAKTKQIEGTIVFANYQTNGKGQGENIWESEKGTNILMSVILYPEFLEAENQFFLSMVFSLAILRTIEKFTKGNCRIKWPNDIYLNDKKISGLLIQNTLRGNKIKSTVIGIGLNVNQVDFGNELNNVTSIFIENNTNVEIDEVLRSLIINMNKYYMKLLNEKFNLLKAEFENKIYRRNQLSSFYLANGEVVNGTIRGIKESGELSVEIGGEKRKYIHGEIKIVL